MQYSPYSDPQGLFATAIPLRGNYTEKRQASCLKETEEEARGNKAAIAGNQFNPCPLCELSDPL